MTTNAMDDIDPDYAKAIADKTMNYMALHGIAPTPNNFATWFSYSRGDQPALKRKIDVLVGAKTQFDAAQNRELYDIYVGRSRVAPGELPDQFKSIMDEASQYVTAAIADNHTQMRVMGEVADQATSGIEPRLLVKRLMQELSGAAERTSHLQAKLTDTSRELDVIRESLSSAEQRASTDMLTGLANRRAFDEFLRNAQSSAANGGQPLGLMMLDIDHFKHFNDNFGHGVGDQVLRLIANSLRDRLRENDLPARYGGEELIAVLPGATLAVCEAVAERIRRSIGECKLTRRSTGETLPSVTVSIGVAQFRFGETPEQLIERCDEALYLAKRTGRNRVVTEARVEGRNVA